MDQTKIGRFIAERRKSVNLTQMQLAEKLCVTDRAVSKWETGRSMPDSSIMLELCDALGISVNDLLCGEVVQMENYNKETENKLLEMIKEKERKGKQLLMLEWVVLILSCMVLFIPIFIAAWVPMEDCIKVVLVFSGLIPALIGLHFAIKIEQNAGYYECKHCKNRYIPTIGAMYAAMHMGRTRYMRCPKCHKRSWQKKVLSEK